MSWAIDQPPPGDQPRNTPSSSLTSVPESPRLDRSPIKPPSLSRPAELHRPSDSWETAYVFAFLYKFTRLCRDFNCGLFLRSVNDLECALEEPPLQAKIASETVETAAEEPDSVSRKILTQIIITFHENLRVVNTSTWPRWLPSYVEEIVRHEGEFPKMAVLNWKENYLKTRPGGFWSLNWQEKVHLLRILVDHQITYSANVRAIIDSTYEKAKIAKAPANSSGSKADAAKQAAAQNPLLIKPLGLDRHVQTWWQIDDSPRLYCSGNPYKATCPWRVLTTSHEEFAKIEQQLARDPDAVASTPPAVTISPLEYKDNPQTGELKLKIKIPPMFTPVGSRKAAAARAKRIEPGIKMEWQLSSAIDHVAKPRILSRQQEIQTMIDQKNKIEERESRKQRRVELTRQQPFLTRDTPGYGVRSRLRSQLSRPDYNVDTVAVDRQFERALLRLEKISSREDPLVQKHQASKRKRKNYRCRSASGGSDDEAWEAREEDDKEANDATDDEEDASDSNRYIAHKKRCRSRKPVQARPQGERRSSRVKLKMEEEAEAEEEARQSSDEVSKPSSLVWSRSTVPESPGVCEPPEGSTEKVDPDGNVSVWSRGKLVYVAGNNRYASKPVAAPIKKKAIATLGSSSVTTTYGTSTHSNPLPTPSAPSSSRSLVTLQARLDSMAGDSDDEEAAVGTSSDLLMYEGDHEEHSGREGAMNGRGFAPP